MSNELTSVEWFKLAHETAKELIAPWKWALLITMGTALQTERLESI